MHSKLEPFYVWGRFKKVLRCQCSQKYLGCQKYCYGFLKFRLFWKCHSSTDLNSCQVLLNCKHLDSKYNATSHTCNPFINCDVNASDKSFWSIWSNTQFYSLWLETEIKLSTYRQLIILVMVFRICFIDFFGNQILISCLLSSLYE